MENHVSKHYTMAFTKDQWFRGIRWIDKPEYPAKSLLAVAKYSGVMVPSTVCMFHYQHEMNSCEKILIVIVNTNITSWCFSARVVL